MTCVGPPIERVQMLGSDQSSADVIQLALTPVFLLTAVAALLNVFSTRLGRVADRVDLLSADLQRGAADTEFLSAQLVFLRLARCGIQGPIVRSFWRCDCLHDYSLGYICNRNDNGWTWAKGRRPLP